MNLTRDAAICVRVDLTNPGQFFACCGLLELADRLWGGAEGWFDDRGFSMRSVEAGVSNNLAHLLQAIAQAPLSQVDPKDEYSSALKLPSPFEVRLDWWQDTRSGGKRLKVWAGSMRNSRIACAMQSALRHPDHQNDAVLNYQTVVFDPLQPDEKVEPFYFDSRRGASAQSIDIGFAPDSLKMTSAAYPAVEFLCLVGLQRFRPIPGNARRSFHYHTWRSPLTALVAPAAVGGLLRSHIRDEYRFENVFRTDQRKHKAFTPATRLQGAT